MHIRLRAILVGALMALPLVAQTQAQTFPGADWQRKSPADAGINPQLLKEAVDFAIASEIKNPRDLKLNHYRTFGREPFGDAIGPIKDRGDQTGVVVHKGAIVAEWGEPQRVDMTHSVTKSLLSSVVGAAFDSGLIRNVDDTAREYVAPVQLYNPAPTGNRADRMRQPDLIDLFDTPHNRTITWNHLLRQTSDWEGTLWGKPDWADRPSEKPDEWLTRPRNKAGTVYKYNDTRVNRLGATEPVTADEGDLALVEFARGATGSLESSGVATGRKNQQAWEINGSQGSVSWDLEDPNHLQVYLDDGPLEGARGFTSVSVTDPSHPLQTLYLPPGHNAGWEYGHLHALYHFVDCVVNDIPVAPLGATFDDGYRVQVIMDAINRSSRSRRRIDLRF